MCLCGRKYHLRCCHNVGLEFIILDLAQQNQVFHSRVVSLINSFENVLTNEIVWVLVLFWRKKKSQLLHISRIYIIFQSVSSLVLCSVPLNRNNWQLLVTLSLSHQIILQIIVGPVSHVIYYKEKLSGEYGVIFFFFFLLLGCKDLFFVLSP